MPRYTPKVQTFLGGQNTKASPAGLPLGQHELVKNTRFNEGGASRRAGMQRIEYAQETGNAILLNPDGTDGTAYVEIPLHVGVHQLPTEFTLDVVVNPDEIAGSSGDVVQILGFEDGEDTFTLWWTSDNTIAFSLTDTGSTQYTLESDTAYSVSSPDTSIPIRVVRDGSTLTMTIAGTEVASRTDLDATRGSVAPTSDLLIGSKYSGTDSEYSFSGVIDELRIFHIALSGHEHAWVEWHDPRYPALVAHYRFDEQTATGHDNLIVDDSRYGNHGQKVGGVTFTTGLVTAVAPIVGIRCYQHSSGTRKLLFAAGMNFYESTVV